MYKRIYVLKFTKENCDQPVICRLVKQYDLEFNILKATVLFQHEGVMVLQLSGHKEKVKAGVEYLKGIGVGVEKLATIIHRDDEKCFQCGACTGICPTGALHLKRPEIAVLFDVQRCTGCGLCVPVCPVRAMEISLGHTVSALCE